jgi:hypothetical protein
MTARYGELKGTAGGDSCVGTDRQIAHDDQAAVDNKRLRRQVADADSKPAAEADAVCGPEWAAARERRYRCTFRVIVSGLRPVKEGRLLFHLWRGARSSMCLS